MRSPSCLRLGASALILAMSWAGGAAAQDVPPAATPDPILDGFRAPPQSARPRVWWHWLNGNITERGITEDLEWMHRIGIGGAQTFDASLGTPQVVDRRLAYMTPEWKHAFAHTAREADRLGLELGIAVSPGWSETGGPWVPPADAMKKLTWSVTDVTGGHRLTSPLAAPPATTGPFQDIGFVDALAGPGGPPPPSAHGEVAVLAFPLAAAPLTHAQATDSAGRTLDAALLVDGRMSTAVDLPKGTPEHPGQVTIRYDRPRRMSAVTLYIAGALPMFGDPAYLPAIEAEVGGRWRKLADAPLTNVPTTVSFAPVVARAIRVTLAPNTGAKRPGLGSPAPGAMVVDIFPSGPPSTSVKLGELAVHDGPTVNRAEAKAGFTTALDYYALGAGLPAAGIDPTRVVDLTTRMAPDGTLDWTPPAGRWRIVRLGWSLLGTTNHPAAPEATGLEVDKYDGAAVRRYLERYLATYRDAAGPDLVGAHGVRAMVTDSIEAGDSNWTPDLVAAFRRLRGYDPIPFLPALTGVVIGSAAQSDAFLYDYRRTLADLIADQHYGTIASVAHEHGLTLYGEALEDQRPLLGDDMAMRAHTDVPMAAMWTYGAEGPRPTLVGDDRGAASVAHIYGQNIVAAESMTAAFAPWAFGPADLRPVIDLEFANGINRPVVHTSVHSPMDDKEPGLSLAIFGQYFNRHETWAEMAGAWVDYIARTSFMLQQGRNVADVAYFYGEEAPITALNAYKPITDVPPGWAWDYVNADALRDAVLVEGHEIVATGGARYRLLYLGGTSRRMTLPTLRRIAALAEAGATVVGMPPEGDPSLADDADAFAALVRRLWPGGGDTRIGQGRVVAAASVAAGLQAAGVAPDLDVGATADAQLPFVHRRVSDGDIYWLDNRGSGPATIEAHFRVTGRAPELWHADTGAIEPLPFRMVGDQTIVPLLLAPAESVFVVFRKPASQPAREVPRPVEQPLMTLSAPWSVRFQPGRGAPASTTMSALHPLEQSGDAGIRYFSGVATYASRFVLPANGRPGAPLWLDLGRVGDLAEVRINGDLVGTAWHAPYRLDIARAAHRGSNTIEVRVANLWVNRLIGDMQPGATKVTFTAAPTYRPDAPLRPSGLIGPVTLAR